MSQRRRRLSDGTTRRGSRPVLTLHCVPPLPSSHSQHVPQTTMGGAHSLSNAAKQKHTNDGSGHGLSWGLSAMQGYRPTMEVLAPSNPICTPKICWMTFNVPKPFIYTSTTIRAVPTRRHVTVAVRIMSAPPSCYCYCTQDDHTVDQSIAVMPKTSFFAVYDGTGTSDLPHLLTLCSQYTVPHGTLATTPPQPPLLRTMSLPVSPSVAIAASPTPPDRPPDKAIIIPVLI